VNPFSAPSTPPIGPWLQPWQRLLILLILYAIARAAYFVTIEMG